MNKKYNKAVFEFFTEDEDRFLMMGKIVEHQSRVKTELIKFFWEKLQQKLEEKFSDKEGDWIVRFSDDWDFPNNKIVIYKKSWCFYKHNFPLVCVAFESLYQNNHPFLGILSDRIGYGNTSYYDIDKINIKLRATPAINLLGIDDDDFHWSVWQHLNFHLKDFENLANLLPENAEKTINFLIADVERYTIALEDFMIDNDNLKAYKLQK
ncbi:MAG: hypothetical protein AB8G11_10760 [Saprospiraceae bacterium]